ncbi:histidine kinase dimerization/phosphoacceptor domain -containing protein [Ekhidna sp.]|uniref:histidine kinase dimerization/phosphoacceptor domain -containing protein n=1 Tax=Ekhidna sp. TaxID=2608089 RepID=UPI003CCBF13E
MKGFIHLIVFLGLTISTCYGQLDSLRKNVFNATEPKSRIDALNDLAHFKIKYSFKECDSIANIALSEAEQINYEFGIGKAHLVLGWVNWQFAYYAESLHHLKIASKIFKKLDDPSNLAHALRIRGLLHHYLVQTDSAIKYLGKAADLFELTQDTAYWSLTTSELSFPYAHTYNMDKANELAVKAYEIKITYESIGIQYNTWLFSDRTNQAYQNEAIIGSIIPPVKQELKKAIRSQDPYTIAKKYSEVSGLFQMIENYDSALVYRIMAKDIYDSLNEANRMAFELMDIGLYRQILGDVNQAEKHYKEALQLLLKENSHHGIGVALDYLGKLVMGQGRYDEALDYFNDALILSDTLDHKIDVIRFLRRLSDVYRNAGQYEKSIEKASASYQLSLEVTSPSHIMWGAEKLMMAYERMGNYEQAFKYQTIFRDNQLKRERSMASRQNLEFQSLYELNEKTKTIELLNKENENKEIRINLQRTYLISAISGIGIVLLFALILRNRISKIQSLNRTISDKNQLLLERNDEKEVLLREIHHRVKNNLQMISSLVGMQKRRLENEEYKKIFGDTQKRLKSISLIHEQLYQSDSLATIYLRPYLIELIEGIIHSFDGITKPELKTEICECEVDLDTAIPIGLIVNELLINSFKHAFVDHDHPKLMVELHKNNDGYLLKVKDNGPGVSTISDGFGWVAIKSMINGLDGTYEIINNDGLCVVIEF